MMLGLKIFYILILLILGFLFTFKSKGVYSISWYSKHNLDEEGRRQFIIAYKIFGVFMLIGALFIIISIF